jgi:hypothetical protein
MKGEGWRLKQSRLLVARYGWHLAVPARAPFPTCYVIEIEGSVCTEWG